MISYVDKAGWTTHQDERWVPGSDAWMAWAPGYVRDMISRGETTGYHYASRIARDAEEFRAHCLRVGRDFAEFCASELGTTEALIVAVEASYPALRDAHEAETQRRIAEATWSGEHAGTDVVEVGRRLRRFLREEIRSGRFAPVSAATVRTERHCLSDEVRVCLRVTGYDPIAWDAEEEEITDAQRDQRARLRTVGEAIETFVRAYQSSRPEYGELGDIGPRVEPYLSIYTTSEAPGDW